MTDKQMEWRIALLRRLIIHPKGAHRRRIRMAIWLYLYLLVHADDNRYLRRQISTICSDMKAPQSTVIRWFTILRNGGYITTRNDGRGLTIKIENLENTVVGRSN